MLDPNYAPQDLYFTLSSPVSSPQQPHTFAPAGKSAAPHNVNWARQRSGGGGWGRKGGGLRGEAEQSSNPVKWIDLDPNCPLATVSWKNRVKLEDPLHLADESEQVPDSDGINGQVRLQTTGWLENKSSFFLSAAPWVEFLCGQSFGRVEQREWGVTPRTLNSPKGGGWGFSVLTQANTTNH